MHADHQPSGSGVAPQRRLREMISERQTLDRVFRSIRVPVLLTYDSACVAGHSCEDSPYPENFVASCARSTSASRGRDLPAHVIIDLILVPCLIRPTSSLSSTAGCGSSSRYDVRGLKRAVATAESANERAFEVLADLGGLVARAKGEESTEMTQAREIAIRLVEHRDGLGGQAAPLDAMLRRLGLFPYIDAGAAGVRDRLAIEAHRPLDLPDERHRLSSCPGEVYRRLLDGENVVLSAPTSFGKSLVIDASSPPAATATSSSWSRRSR